MSHRSPLVRGMVAAVSWRIALFAGVFLAVVCAAVGFTLDTSQVTVSSADEAREASWPSPFEREIRANITPSAVPARSDFARLEERLRAEELLAAETDGDQRIWYFAAGAVLVLTLASLPLLRERDRRRVRQSAGG